MAEIQLIFQRRIDEVRQNNAKELDLSAHPSWQDSFKLKEIPAEVFDLNQLESLNLSGNLLVNLPDKLGSMANLQVLDLSSNKFNYFPSVIFNLKKLTCLDISHCFMQQLPANLYLNSSLDTLKMSHNYINSIPTMLYTLPNLKYLKIGDGNTFDWAGLANLSNLTGLSIVLEDGHVVDKVACDEIKQLSKLEDLSLIGKQIPKMPDWIGELTNLRQLKIRGLLDTKLPSSWVKLQKLSSFHIGLLNHNVINLDSEQVNWLTSLPLISLSLEHFNFYHAPN